MPGLAKSQEGAGRVLGEMEFKAYHTPVFPECCLSQILGLPCALEEEAHLKNIL